MVYGPLYNILNTFFSAIFDGLNTLVTVNLKHFLKIDCQIGTFICFHKMRNFGTFLWANIENDGDNIEVPVSYFGWRSM